MVTKTAILVRPGAGAQDQRQRAEGQSEQRLQQASGSDIADVHAEVRKQRSERDAGESSEAHGEGVERHRPTLLQHDPRAPDRVGEQQAHRPARFFAGQRAGTDGDMVTTMTEIGAIRPNVSI